MFWHAIEKVGQSVIQLFNVSIFTKKFMFINKAKAKEFLEQEGYDANTVMGEWRKLGGLVISYCLNMDEDQKALALSFCSHLFSLKTTGVRTKVRTKKTLI